MIHAASTSVLIRAYARAYWHVYSALWDASLYERVVALLALVQSSNGVTAYMRFCSLHADSKIKPFDRLLRGYALEVACVPLLRLLFERGHGGLFIPITRLLVLWYEREQGIVHVTVHTARALAEVQQERVGHWIKEAVPATTVHIHYRVDQALIAGMRVETPESMGEYSVRRQLRRLSQLCNNKDIRWQ